MNCLLQFPHSMFAKRTAIFGAAVVSALLGVGTVHAEGAPEKPAAKTSKPAAKKLYSAERSLTRQAKLARARAAAEAREVAAAQPHYKLDASGEVVPDVRAAAAII